MGADVPVAEPVMEELADGLVAQERGVELDHHVHAHAGEQVLADALDLLRRTAVEGGEGDAGGEAVGDELFELILEVASGRQPLSEQWGIGQDEFAPWIVGAVM